MIEPFEPVLARTVEYLESDEVCETCSRDRGGKCQGQRDVTLPRIW